MDVYLRRNLDIQFNCTIQNPETVKELMPEPTPEQRSKMEEAEQARKKVEENIWQQVEAMEEPLLDLCGNPVTRETHEIGFDYDWVEGEDGLTTGRAVKAWIRPKKSEYLMER